MIGNSHMDSGDESPQIKKPGVDKIRIYITIHIEFDLY